ncbi:hypothetical protein SAMN02910406_03613 [Ruminococcus albus]|uniref:Uncharacterized protein n=1 Tax=Ruminococcus albus TaxID=1264 RepID=A0A1I1R737_RUMAL|nr:hypothetical protein SAMN02910406_03613 [Ruminococcus albus]
MPENALWTLFWTLLGKILSGDHVDARSPEFCLGVICALTCLFPLDYLRNNIAMMTFEQGFAPTISSLIAYSNMDEMKDK